MLCDVCHEREARIMFTEIINGNKREQHLCEQCAGDQARGLQEKLGTDLSFGSILSGILQNYAKGITTRNNANEPVCLRCGMTATDVIKEGRLGCPQCYDVFSLIIDKNLKANQGADEHAGKFPQHGVKTEIHKKMSSMMIPGLEEAVNAARRGTQKASVSKLKNSAAQGENVKNEGKPEEANRLNNAGEDLEQLKLQLRGAIEDEDFDLAAVLRDRIHALENAAGEKSGSSGKSKKNAAPKEPGKKARRKAEE